MGMFLSLSGVIGKSNSQVESSLREYLNTKSGGLTPKKLDHLDDNCSILAEGENGTTIFYPYGFMQWDESSLFLSENLNCPVFSFHVHDGDFWMFMLYNNGELIDQFNPIPDYWDENITKKEIEEFSGNPELISQIIESVEVKTISNYFNRWDLETESLKAYPDDEFENEDWQLVDFMRKIGLEYPLNDSDKPKGKVYEFWTKELKRVKNEETKTTIKNPINNKRWWKIW